MVNPKIEDPGGYVPAFAVDFAGTDGCAITVSNANPLPVSVVASVSANASLADQSVLDASGVYWLVRDTGTALSYLNWSTGVAGTPAAPVAPIGAQVGRDLRVAQFIAAVTGAGYAVGDTIEHVIVVNLSTNPTTVVSSAWLNLTQATVLTAAPASAALNPVIQGVTVNASALPAGAATAANQPAISGDGGALAHITNFPATQPVSGSVTVDNLPATQAVSAASLPLPTGAAMETGGNLAALASAQGADGTGIAQPTGGAGIRGWLSGIYKAVSGTLSVNWSGQSVALAAGGNTAAVDATYGLAVKDQQLYNLMSGNASAPLHAQSGHGVLIGAVEGTGTAGTPSTYVMSVQGVSGGTPQPIGGTYNATPPALIAGQSSGAQMDAAGNLKVYDLGFATHAPAQYPVVVTSSAQSLTTLIGGAVPAWATMARVMVLTGTVYYRSDGTTATTTNAMPIPQAMPWEIPSAAALSQLSLIAPANSAAVIEFRG